jgi:hypothetical protein
MPSLRPFLYMVVGALVLAAGLYGPKYYGPALHLASERMDVFRSGDPSRPIRVLYAQNQPAFAAMVQDIEHCAGTGLISLYANGQVMDTASDSVKCGASADIEQRMRTLGIEWVNIEGGQPGDYTATFVLLQDKDAFDVSRSSIIYNPNPSFGVGRNGMDLANGGHWLFSRGR